MNTPVKLVAIGKSTGFVLPEELRVRLRVKPGDTLSYIECEGGIELRKPKPRPMLKRRLFRGS